MDIAYGNDYAEAFENARKQGISETTREMKEKLDLLLNLGSGGGNWRRLISQMRDDLTKEIEKIDQPVI